MESFNSKLAEQAIKSLKDFGYDVDPSYLLSDALKSVSDMVFEKGYLVNKKKEIIDDLNEAKRSKNVEVQSRCINESIFNIRELINMEEYMNSKD